MTTTATYDLVEFKADEEAQGLFAAIVSVFGNKDRNGDRMLRGAFKRTLDEWKARGKPVPVIFNHDHNDPSSYIGSVDPADIQETPRGLVVAGRLDIDSNPKARQVWQLLKDGRINQWSFAFTARKERIAKEDLARELSDVDLFEVGPTLVGANDLTTTLAVKSTTDSDSTATSDTVVVSETLTHLAPTDDVLQEFEAKVDALLEEKIGRVMNAKTEAAVRAAISQLEMILGQLDHSEETDTSDVGAKSEEPASAATAPTGDRIHEAERFVADRGRLTLTSIDTWLGERAG